MSQYIHTEQDVKTADWSEAKAISFCKYIGDCGAISPLMTLIEYTYAKKKKVS